MKKLSLLLLILGGFFTPVYILAQPSGGGGYPSLSQILSRWTGTKDATHFLAGDGTMQTASGGSATSLSLSNITSGTLNTTLALGNQNITSTGNSSVTVGNLLFQDNSEALGFTNSSRAIRMPGGLLCSNTAVTTGYIAINGGNGTVLTGGATLQVQGATATINPGYAILGCGGVSGALVQLKDKNGTAQLTVSEAGINGTGRATLDNLTLSGQATTGIAHVGSGGAVTSSALTAAEIPTHNESLSNITSGTLVVPLALGTQNITNSGNNTAIVPSGNSLNVTSAGTGILGLGQSSGVQGDGRFFIGGYGQSSSINNSASGIQSSGTNLNVNSGGGTIFFRSSGTAVLDTVSTGIQVLGSISTLGSNLLLQGGAAAAGRVEIADRVSIMAAGTPNSYADPGAGGLYLDGSILGSATAGSFIIAPNTVTNPANNSSVLIAGSSSASVSQGGVITVNGANVTGTTGTLNSGGSIILKATGAGVSPGAGVGLFVNSVSQFFVTSVGGYIGIASPATTATTGFPNIPVCAGTPTGVPTLVTGFVPMVYDSTGHKLWIYDGGWKMAAFI